MTMTDTFIIIISLYTNLELRVSKCQSNYLKWGIFVDAELGRCVGDDVIAVSAADVTHDVFLADIVNSALTTATGQPLCGQKYPCLQNGSTHTRCYTRY